MTKEECHEYKFELTFSQYNSEEEISDIILERILNIMINTTMEEDLRMGGGYHKYFWIDTAGSWLLGFLADWRGRILRLLSRSIKRKGCVVIIDEEGWTKMYAVKPEVGT